MSEHEYTERVEGGRATVSAHDSASLGCRVVSWVYCPPLSRGTGVATRLMRRCVEEADQDGVDLLLDACACREYGNPNSENAMDQATLERWYASFGFALVEGGQFGRYMRRPCRVLEVSNGGA